MELQSLHLGVGRIIIPSRPKGHSGGHRRFSHDVLFPNINDGLTILYARVSSRDQKENLQRQENVLTKHAALNQWENVQTIQDIGSGLNTGEPGVKETDSACTREKDKTFGYYTQRPFTTFCQRSFVGHF